MDQNFKKHKMVIEPHPQLAVKTWPSSDQHLLSSTHNNFNYPTDWVAFAFSVPLLFQFSVLLIISAVHWHLCINFFCQLEQKNLWYTVYFSFKAILPTQPNVSYKWYNYIISNMYVSYLRMYSFVSISFHTVSLFIHEYVYWSTFCCCLAC